MHRPRPSGRARYQSNYVSYSADQFLQVQHLLAVAAHAREAATLALHCVATLTTPKSYTRRRTLLTSSSSLKGLVIYMSAPCRSPQDLSSEVFLFVNKMMGMCLLASRLLSLRQS